METIKDRGDVLKQALQQRQTGSLPSNFSFRMMEQIRHEAVRQQKRKERPLFICLLAAVVVLVTGVACYLLFFMDIQLSTRLLPSLVVPQASSPLMGFYCYIAGLASLLVGLDYWVRRKRSA